PAELVALKADRAGGGRVVRLKTQRAQGASVPRLAVATAAIREMVESSPKIHVFDADPLALVAHREGERVLIRCPQPGTRLTLEGPGRVVLDRAESSTDAAVALHAPDPTLDPYRHRVVATWTTAGTELRRVWTLERLVGTIEREVSASNRIHAGGVMACRIKTSNTLDGQPVVARRGTCVLLREGVELASAPYVTDAHGYAHPTVLVGSHVEPGLATLAIDEMRFPVQIDSGVRVSVVTDRPLYKADDRVHVRAMAHRVGDGRPVANAELTLSIGDAKRTVTTSAHGIASHTFELIEARVGASRVKAVCEGAETHCNFRVKAFERPTFTVEAEPAFLTLKPGDSAPLTLHARYVNGTPLVGGVIESSARGPLALGKPPTRTEASGQARFTVTARRAGTGSGVLRVRVVDTDGRMGNVSIPVSVERSGPELDAVPLSDVARGIPTRIELRASAPTALTLEGSFAGPRAISIDASGRATITVVPTTEQLTLKLTAAEGTQSSHVFACIPQGPEALALVLDRRAARVGEPRGVSLRGPAGLVCLDAWRDDALVFTRTLQLGEEGADVSVPLDPRMAGVLRLHARSADGAPVARRATVLVTRGRALQVEAETPQDAYAPGAEAAVDVTVRDSEGELTSAVLGYWGVDTALLALAPMTSGHETVFDVLSAKPVPTAYQAALQADGQQSLPAASIAHGFGDTTVAAATPRRYPIHALRTPALVAAATKAQRHANDQRVRAVWTAYANAWEGMPLLDLTTSDSVRETLAWLVGRGALDSSALDDAWGAPYKLWMDHANVEVTLVSAGPDGRFGTPDDLRTTESGVDLYLLLPERIRDFHSYVREHYDSKRRLPRRTMLDEQMLFEEDTEEIHEQEIITEEPVIMDEEIADLVETDNDLPFEESFGESEGLAALGAAFEGPATNSMIGLGGGAGGAFRGRGGGRDLGTGGGGRRHYPKPPTPYVRKDFDPTLCFVPEAIVGPSGRARLAIPLKDSITTWQLRLVASDASGAVGVGTGRIRVRQSVHAAPWLAPHLTVGDVVDVPVAVRNEESRGVIVSVQATTSEHLVALGSQTITLEVGPLATGRATLRYRAVRTGKARVRLVAATPASQDMQERIVHVHPHARTIVDVLNGSVTSDARFPTVMAAAGPGEVRMDLYPSPL
ncbi:MAG: alpha-2-macroglobulin family protein, partial [Planctomycetota bacterium]|nr:alpha-2-macroglobulin family protein [Planctomycetota bacterium]